MEVLKIHLFQSSANYKREEVIENKMTYPLPPYSTIIGALHNICDFTEYKEMEVSVQGCYGSLVKKAYTDYCFLDSLQDDRGILIKMCNTETFSKSYEKVAFAKKSQGNSFRKNETVQILNEDLILEYRQLKDLNDKIIFFKNGRFSSFKGLIKKRKQTLSRKKKLYQKNSEEYIKLDLREKEIKQLEKEADIRMRRYEQINYDIPYSRFRTLTTSLKYYELLTDVELVIHVKCDLDIMNKILENIYKMKSLGRSEDFVDIKKVEIVELKEVDGTYKSKYHSYIKADLIDVEESVYTKERKGIRAIGTKYYINKVFDKYEDKRVFEKVKVYYTSEYEVYEDSKSVYIDSSEDEPLIVTFA